MPTLHVILIFTAHTHTYAHASSKKPRHLGILRLCLHDSHIFSLFTFFWTQKIRFFETPILKNVNLICGYLMRFRLDFLQRYDDKLLCTISDVRQPQKYRCIFFLPRRWFTIVKTSLMHFTIVAIHRPP